jgi:hypothetical protein
VAAQPVCTPSPLPSPELRAPSPEPRAPSPLNPKHVPRASSLEPQVTSPEPGSEYLFTIVVIGRWRAAAVINAVIDDLAKDSEQRKKKVRMDERPARESADKAQPAAAKAGEADGPSSARFNRRGNRVPVDSPPDLLTDERDGNEGASVLVLPIPYGRTRALRVAVLGRCESIRPTYDSLCRGVAYVHPQLIGSSTDKEPRTCPRRCGAPVNTTLARTAPSASAASTPPMTTSLRPQEAISRPRSLTSLIWSAPSPLTSFQALLLMMIQ